MAHPSYSSCINIMINSTQVSFFTLSAYIDSGPLRYLYFMLLFSLYVLIVGCNVLLIVVICVNRTLHEPMYMFLSSLFVNQLYGSTGLFPFLLIQILSDVHIIAAPLCFLQVFCVYTYGSIEVFNLAVMSYDRYVAICLPLQYQALMTSKRVAVLIAVSWLFPYFSIAVLVSLSAPLPLCGNVIDRIYCGNYSIVKLSCLDTRLNNILGLLYTAVSISLPLFMILYSYTKILEVCFSGSKLTRQKAVSTCSPHLACILNFFFGCCFQIVQSRFDLSGVPAVLAIILSLYFLTCQPLFNPLLYGLKMSAISEACKRLICGENTNNSSDMMSLAFHT